MSQLMIINHIMISNIGIECPPPPPLPPNYVCRQQLLDEMVSKLCQSTMDPNSYGTSLTVTGAGGFGKTSVAIAFCHCPEVKEQFTDGVVFIELGPQATDPSMKLSQLYHLLTGQYLKQGDINHAEQEINKLTSLCHNLLVIIDDVWHVEDAEPIVKAFSNCKIVLTTRMNDIEQYIPTKQVVSVGPMEKSEAISLLTYGVIDIGQLSQEDVSLLDELAQDVHLWPLLLSLIRGQLSHNLRHQNLSHHEAINYVQVKLFNKGLTAFDKNDIDKSRKYAVKVCIEVTLELLRKMLADKLKSLILFTGIGTSLQMESLPNLWNIAEYEAIDAANALWNYGLIQYTDIRLPPHNNAYQCIEVHATISQYIIENMNSNEVHILSPMVGLGTYESVLEGMILSVQRSYGTQDVSSLPAVDYLKYRLGIIEHIVLPFHLKQINTFLIYEPHYLSGIIQHIQGDLVILHCPKNGIIAPPNIQALLKSVSEQIKSLVNDCQRILYNAQKISRRLRQSYEKFLTQKDYSSLIQVIEQHNLTNSIASVAQNAVTVVKQVISICDGELQYSITERCEKIQTMTSEYNPLILNILPHIKLHIKLIQQINSALLAGSSCIEQMCHYIKSRKIQEEYNLLKMNWLIKLKDVAPNYVYQITSQQVYTLKY